jgi:type II secretory pathway predicted ATPase ExeA
MRRPSNLMKSTTAPVAALETADPGPPKNYLDLYGLSKPPFSGPRERGSYILFNSQRRGFELLVEHVVNGSGIVLLQGEEGAGKTETLRAVADAAAEAGLRTIVLSRPANGRVTLVQMLSALKGQPNANEVTVDDAIAHFLAPPRKTLLADDLDLMPADCGRLLLSLAQRLPDAPGGPAIVLSSSTGLTAEPTRPELSQLAGFARDTIRLPKLGPGEIQQYIERSLWIAGGTTRRLITPDAMKLLIIRSGGAPGIANRLMEAALTAGFARGDPMITAKTITAAMGPAAPRPRPRSRPRTSESSGSAGRAIQIVSIALLLLGTAVFLYRGLTGQPARGPAESAKPIASATPEAPPLAERSPAAKPAENLSPELVAALMKRGDQSLGLGDIAAARLLYQRAAEAGNASAATALGKTYDPNFAAPGSTPSPARATEWYQKAITLGDAQAADLLRRLSPPNSDKTR